MDSDESQELFTDDDDDLTSRKYPFHSSPARSLTNLSDVSVIESSPVRESSSDTAVIPCTPVSLYPLLSNEPAVWTADLETPQRPNGSPNNTDTLNSEVVPKTPSTPSDEIIPPSQQPTRRAKRRRIFHESNKSNISKLDQRLRSDDIVKMISNDNEPSTSRLTRISEELVEPVTDKNTIADLVKKLRQSKRPKILETVDINDSESARMLKSFLNSEKCVPERKMLPVLRPNDELGLISFSELCANEQSGNIAKGFLSSFRTESQLKSERFDIFCENYIENCVTEDDPSRESQISPNLDMTELRPLTPVQISVDSGFKSGEKEIKLNIDAVITAKMLFQKDEEIMERMKTNIDEFLGKKSASLCSEDCTMPLRRVRREDGDISQPLRSSKSPSVEFSPPLDDLNITMGISPPSDESVRKSEDKSPKQEPDTQPLDASFDVKHLKTSSSDGSSSGSLPYAQKPHSSSSEDAKNSLSSNEMFKTQDFQFDDLDLDKTLVQETSFKAVNEVLEDTVVMDSHAMDSDDDFTIAETDFHEIETTNFPGFKTARGSCVNISDKARKAAEKIWIEAQDTADGEFDDDFAVPAPRVTPTIERGQENDLSAANSKSAPPLMGFRTGQGKQLTISKTAMSKAQTAYVKDIENNEKGTKLYARSEPLLGKKRKNDDNTPLGRKKPRLGSDLQRRKLFNELQEEDRYLSEIMLPSAIKNSPRNIQSKGSSEEIHASVAALLNEASIHENWDSLEENQSQSLPEVTEISKTCTKLKSPSPHHLESIPEDICFDSLFSQELSLLNTSENREKRSAAILDQEKMIQVKKIRRERAIRGSLLQLKESRSHISLNEMFGGHLPVKKTPRDLANDEIETSVISMDPTTASAYKFNCVDFYGEIFMINHNDGIPLDDRAILIPNAEHQAGVDEFKRAFLAAPGVSPALLPNGWFENHFKWIVWKLACMDRIKSKTNAFPRFLTPDRVMSQLKYRYDREIDLCQRPALRRILEKDDAPSRRMVLCVSKIFPPTNLQGSFKNACRTIEVTDGWYSVTAVTDYAMAEHLNSGKVTVGTKLITSGAEILNLGEGHYPLDIPGDVQLKIHTNSTRRARWHVKLGYQSQRGPMKFHLTSIHPSGGLIGKIVVAVARVYPILYREKTQDGQFIDRNARCEEKAMDAYEKECESRIDAVYSRARESKGELSPADLKNRVKNSLPPKREVTPIAKIRVVDGNCTAVITLKCGAEESQSIFKENTFITVCNVMTTGKGHNELQISTARYSAFTPAPLNANIPYSKRIFTSLEDVSKPGFHPSFSEFDTVGVVVSTGPAPHGMKNFECVNLAFQRDNTSDSPNFYLSILFWINISAFGFTESTKIGSVIACLNLEWRTSAYRSIPIAYCTEKTVLTCNPKQNHIRLPFESLRDRIKDVDVYVQTNAAAIQDEVTKKSKLTPQSTSRIRSNSSTPLSHGKSNKDRIDQLRNYGNAPDLSPIFLEKSPRVALSFRSPVNSPKPGDSSFK